MKFHLKSQTYLNKEECNIGIAASRYTVLAPYIGSRLVLIGQAIGQAKGHHEQ